MNIQIRRLFVNIGVFNINATHGFDEFCGVCHRWTVCKVENVRLTIKNQSRYTLWIKGLQKTYENWKCLHMHCQYIFLKKTEV